MGREEIGHRTGRIPAKFCWLCFILFYVSNIYIFATKPFDTPFLNGLAAHIASSIIIFAFSFTFSNSSLYDPCWVGSALPVAAGWFLTSEGFSIRGTVTMFLVFLWWSRFMFQWPWEGWTHGLDHEDWRFIDIDRKLGGNSVLYWLTSLFGFHIFPTLIVFFGLVPCEKVWTSGRKGPELGPMDIVAFTATFLGVAISYLADK